MKFPKNALSILLFWMVTLFLTSTIQAQTKQIKRPKNSVGISSVDTFVNESFDLYDKVYKYDGYAAAGTPLEDEDIDVLEDALDDLSGLSESAPDILGDLDGASVLKQGKATLQINRAKKALNYSIKTAKELLLGQREREEKDEENDTASNKPSNDSEESDSNSDSNESDTEASNEPVNISDNLEVYSKFDFVPGDKLLFFDDFSQDFIGDFPSKWNTNASGEVVKIGDIGNWFELKSGYGVYFIPNVKNLPEDYTIEFDILTKGLGGQTSSTARFNVILSDNDKFDEGSQHYAYISIPVGQYGAFSLRARNFFNRNTGDINTDIKADIRKEVLNQPHISISVTKNRYRLWINQTKYVDIPRFIQELNVLKYVKFHINNFKDGEEHLYISNLKVTEGGVDLRRKLLSEGKVSTNGILFDSGSANIKPQSYGIIRQISQVLMQDENIKLNIIGHTDADGTDDANLKLSKSRADAVKQALVNIYNISENRLETEGKGESNPVADNTSTDGKAKNRRVEFIKI
ncbi:OmpA family protein [Flaviramulus sp. BrNp1-15]|uniref:OmpA family protein n=1 Tax=Flaviramulus sp. BrNp1-15 TaxID=2916754 RepID=UPI001EE8AE1B|nr:OmpA family protein [Flaviramulus sp. BrNp1-15]ULC59140.1 OmpA family protein [Flaviramulus sp. BrNp1-15]